MYFTEHSLIKTWVGNKSELGMHSILSMFPPLNTTCIKNNTDMYTNKCKQEKQRITHKSIMQKARDTELNFLKEAFQVSLQSTGNKKFWQTSFKFKDLPKY